MTGKCTALSRKNGVSQALQRYNYLQIISYLRRINSPAVDASTNKQTNIRKIKAEQIGFICPVETPEGSKVGLVKGMSISASVTLDNTKYDKDIIKFISKYIIGILDIDYINFKNYCKVFINGKWLGVTTEANKIIEIIDIAKRKYYQ